MTIKFFKKIDVALPEFYVTKYIRHDFLELLSQVQLMLN